MIGAGKAMASPRVSVKPAIYRWAYERNRLSIEEASARFAHLPEWIAGTTEPTLKQLEAFAKAMHAPIGYFFGDAAPDEPLPIDDFRTVAGKWVARPSPELLDTIYACQLRQDWYRDFARADGDTALPFVGSASMAAPVVDVAKHIGETLGFDVAARKRMSTWAEAHRAFVAQAEEVGILVMCNGVVGSNTHRGLDPDEFRGFALVDPTAPLVFVNGADSTSAQMFTLAHEIAHVWLGATGVSDSSVAEAPTSDVERWCDAVAAELLVPMEVFQHDYVRGAPLAAELSRLSRAFKVSSLVILRRMHDAGGLRGDAYWRSYRAEVARLAGLRNARDEGSSGGDFYKTTAVRTGKRFLRALLVSTLEGTTLYTEAFPLVGVHGADTLHRLGQEVGVA